MWGQAGRVDNFTDAAFAFALSLLVIGNQPAPTLAALQTSMRDVPSFAIGFLIIAGFWAAHLHWRRFRRTPSTASFVLTLALIFIVLIYVRPLQAMALSLSNFLGSSGTRFQGDIGDLFFIYSLGFVAMSGIVTALYLEAMREPGLDADEAATCRGTALAWAIQCGTGLLSVLLSRIDALEIWSAYIYATIPISMGLFGWLYGRSVSVRAAREENG